MIRVVIDANVFVSAILKPNSNPDKVIDLVKQGRITLALSVRFIDMVSHFYVSRTGRREWALNGSSEAARRGALSGYWPLSHSRSCGAGLPSRSWPALTEILRLL